MSGRKSNEGIYCALFAVLTACTTCVAQPYINGQNWTSVAKGGGNLQFNTDGDPQGWHEMGVIEFNGTTVCFKVDLYDVDYAYGSPEPSDPAQTRRVLTLLLPSEY